MVKHSAPDDLGRVRWSGFWPSTCTTGCNACSGTGCGQPMVRAQEFFCDPASQVARFVEGGARVVTHEYANPMGDAS